MPSDCTFLWLKYATSAPLLLCTQIAVLLWPHCQVPCSPTVPSPCRRTAVVTLLPFSQSFKANTWDVSSRVRLFLGRCFIRITKSKVCSQSHSCSPFFFFSFARGSFYSHLSILLIWPTHQTSSYSKDYHTQFKFICGCFTWLSKVLSYKVWIQIRVSWI